MREVDARGTVARLTTFNVPPTPIDVKDEPEVKMGTFELSAEDRASMDKVARGECKLDKVFIFK